MHWLFDSTNAPAIGVAGLLIGCISLIVTLVAFGITIVQLARTADATKAAAKAVAGIKSRVATYDLVFEISRASSSLKEAQRHIRNEAWSDVVEAFASSQDAMNRIAELPSTINAEEREKLRGVVEALNKICSRTEAGIQKGEVAIDKAKTINLVSGYIQATSRLSVSVEGALQ